MALEVDRELCCLIEDETVENRDGRCWRGLALSGGDCQSIVQLSCTASRVFGRLEWLVAEQELTLSLSLSQTPHFRFDHASGSTSARALYSRLALKI